MGSMDFISAQDLDLKWSEKIIYDNQKDGFFQEFINSNSKYIYAMFTNYTFSGVKKAKKIKIISFDKDNMKKSADVSLVGYKENLASKDQYKGLVYYRTIVFEDLLYVFWRKETKEKEELFVQSFDGKLKSLNPLKKIYEISNTGHSRRERSSQFIYVLANKKAGEKIVIGTEKPTENLDVKFEYKVLNKDLTFSDANQIALPIKLISKSYGLTSSYEYGDDGNLYIRSSVSMSKEERKNAKKGESTSYSVLSILDLKSGNINPFVMKFENKNIFDFDFQIDKSTVKIYGFFCDLLKDPHGTDLHGIFYCVIDGKNFTMKSQKFSYFDKSTLDKLFAKDKEDQKKSKGLFKSKKDEKSDEESLDNTFEIEDVQSIDQDNIVLFCTKMYNYSVTTCTSNGKGGTTCYTNYYCRKSNVTVFKLNNEGGIVWASNLDRQITYSNWNIYDLNVINKNGKFYVIYGSDFQTGVEKKGFFSSKSRKQQRDRFEYAVFDYASGAYKKNEFVVNAVNEKKDIKTVDPRLISVIDNKFYVNSDRIRLKPGITAAYCVGAIVCLPVLYFLQLDGNARYGTGNLGVITPLK